MLKYVFSCEHFGNWPLLKGAHSGETAQPVSVLGCEHCLLNASALVSCAKVSQGQRLQKWHHGSRQKMALDDP